MLVKLPNTLFTLTKSPLAISSNEIMEDEAQLSQDPKITQFKSLTKYKHSFENPWQHVRNLQVDS
jgi:hypothetical protein